MLTFKEKRHNRAAKVASASSLNYNIAKTKSTEAKRVKKIAAAQATHGGHRPGAGRKPAEDPISERFPFLAPDSLYPNIKAAAKEARLSINSYLCAVALQYNPGEGEILEPLAPSADNPLKQRFTFRATDADDKLITEKAATAGITPNQFLLRAHIELTKSGNASFRPPSVGRAKPRFKFTATQQQYDEIEARAASLNKDPNEYLLWLAHKDIHESE